MTVIHYHPKPPTLVAVVTRDGEEIDRVTGRSETATYGKARSRLLNRDGSTEGATIECRPLND